MSTTLILQNPGQRRMDFIITFRTDLFIKVYQRIQSADYPVLSILPSANPLNAWDGFSVIGGNAHMYEIVGGLRATLLSAVKTLATWSEVACAHINPQYFIHDVRHSIYFTFPIKKSERFFETSLLISIGILFFLVNLFKSVYISSRNGIPLTKSISSCF